MTVYSGPVFEMAANQFNVIANHLDIPMDERDRLLMPKRAITVSCPIHRDDGTIAVFEGYRVRRLFSRWGRPRAARASRRRSTSARSRHLRCG